MQRATDFPTYCRPGRYCPDCRSKSGKPLRPVSSTKSAIEQRRLRRADDARVIAQAQQIAKPPWQKPPRPSAMRWRRGRGPGSYA